MDERKVDDEITLIPYYRNDEVSLVWYQDRELCKMVDKRDEPYTIELFHAMYDYLDKNGYCYYIGYKGVPVGDITLLRSGEVAVVVSRPCQNRHIGHRCVLSMIHLAGELGMKEVTARIYSFNTPSQRMFLSLGFIQTGEESYTYKL